MLWFGSSAPSPVWLPGCLDMVAVEGRFTFTAERPQLSCAAFFMAEPNEVISLDYDGVDIDCGGGDFITVRSHICTQETSSRWEMKHQTYSVSMTTYLFTQGRCSQHTTCGLKYKDITKTERLVLHVYHHVQYKYVPLALFVQS